MLCPEGRLKPDFPWSFKKFGKAYLMGNLYFFLGSFLPIIFFAFVMQAVIYFDPPWSDDLFSIFKEKQSGELVLVGLMLASFLGGFSLEILYLRKVLKEDGLNFRKLLKLELPAVAGRNIFLKGFYLFRYVALFYLLFVLLNNLLVFALGPAEQETVTMFMQLSGGSMLIFALLAIVCAPIFEEIVFRGFLFQGLRSILRKGILARCLGRSGGMADILAVVISSAAFSLMHLQFQPTVLVGLFLMGCLMAEIFRRTGSLIPAMTLHLVNNSVAVVALLLQK